jgi:hypothetical protein
MRTFRVVLIGAAISLLAGSAAFADVQLTIQNGRVSLVARDATVRQILTEWARIGQTKIVNVERIPGGPVTLELTNVSESEALDVLLRSVSGYMAAPRETAVASLSQFDRIVVMPTSAAPRQATPAPPPTPVFQQTQLPQPPVDDDADDDRPATNVVVPGQNRGPVFNTFPQPQIVNPQTAPVMPIPGVAPNYYPPAGPAVPGTQPAPPSTSPTSPFGGVAVPGMVVPTPQQPVQQPGQVVQPAPPRRPGEPDGDL